MVTAEIKKPARQGGLQNEATDYKIDNNHKNVKSNFERGRETLTRIFSAIPDLMLSMDTGFLTRFGTDTLTDIDRDNLARVQREADELGHELIQLATVRYLAEGKDTATARRLALADFGAIFACGVDFLARGGSV